MDNVGWSVVPAYQAKRGRPVLRGDIADVHGQEQAKRALLLAAAGRASVCWFGPPGTGKHDVGTALLGWMPPLEGGCALEVAAIESLAGIPFSPNVGVSAPSVLLIILVSAAALVGGGCEIQLIMIIYN